MPFNSFDRQNIAGCPIIYIWQKANQFFYAQLIIFHLINQIAKDGNCVIYATCENSELLSITDRMYVMYDGRIMAELETAKTTEDEIMHYATGSEEKYAG